MRFHVQKSLRILRHWSHSVKSRAGLTWSHWCRSHSHEAALPRLSPLPNTPGTFLRWSTGWREGREMCPQFVLFIIFSRLLQVVGRGMGWARFHWGCILSVSPAGVLRSVCFPMRASRVETHLWLTLYTCAVLIGGSKERALLPVLPEVGWLIISSSKIYRWSNPNYYFSRRDSQAKKVDTVPRKQLFLQVIIVGPSLGQWCKLSFRISDSILGNKLKTAHVTRWSNKEPFPTCVYFLFSFLFIDLLLQLKILQKQVFLVSMPGISFLLILFVNLAFKAYFRSHNLFKNFFRQF